MEMTHQQLLLKKLRDERCGGVAAELARQIKKDVTYVNRLFYPPGKKGRKNIGLEIMRACTEAFQLPPGFWEGADVAAAAEEKKGEVFERLDDREQRLLSNFRILLDEDRERLALEIEKAAESRQREIDEILARYGVVSAAERAHARRAGASATTIPPTDALKQRPLPGIDV